MNKIEEIERYFEHALPDSYRQFLVGHSTELEGNAYLYLPSQLLERNKCYETKEYAPGYVCIGSNGGGMAFIIDLSSSDPEVFQVGHGSMNPDDKEFVYASFSLWQQSGFNYE